jgi:hypothetical protein
MGHVIGDVGYSCQHPLRVALLKEYPVTSDYFCIINRKEMLFFQVKKPHVNYKCCVFILELCVDRNNSDQSYHALKKETIFNKSVQLLGRMAEHYLLTSHLLL